MSRLVITGIKSEARIAQRHGWSVLVMTEHTDFVTELAARFERGEYDELLSFGTCGGLDPRLHGGDIVFVTNVIVEGTRLATTSSEVLNFPGLTSGCLVHSKTLVDAPQKKRKLRVTTGADVVDMGTGLVAKFAAIHDIPFTAVLAISDDVTQSIPLAIIESLDKHFRCNPLKLIWGLMIGPSQIFDTVRLIISSLSAFRSLNRIAAQMSQLGI